MIDINNKDLAKPYDYNLILIIAFLAGFTSLAYEIIATKILFYFFNENSITTSSVISVFLFGIGLGSFLFGRIEPKIKSKRQFLLIVQILIALYAILIFPNFDMIPTVFNWSYGILGDSTNMILANKLYISFLYLIIPTILMGMVFPLLIILSIKSIDQLPEKISIIYGVDLFGAVLGALLSGFIFIPFFGIKILIFLSVLINLFIGFSLYLDGKKRFHIVICLLLLSIFSYLIINPFSSNSKIYTKNANQQYLENNNLIDSDKKSYFKKVNVKDEKFFSNSPYGELRVVDVVIGNKQNRLLSIDNRLQCSTIGFEKKNISEIHFVEKAIKSLNKKDLKVLNIGLGCGFSLGEIIKSPLVKTVDLVEVNPLMRKAAEYFNKYTSDPLHNPKVNFILNDGYKYLYNTKQKYDLIILDVESPEIVYSSNLYTQDFYNLVKKSLNKDGIFAQWSYTPNVNLQAINYNTLKTVFPNVSLNISGEFNDIYYFASAKSLKNIKLKANDKSFLQELQNYKDKRVNTLNNPYLAAKWMSKY